MRGVWVEVRRRLGLHALAILGVWPLLSLAMAAVEIRELPYYAVSPGQALLGAAAGTAVLVLDFAMVGALALAVSTLCFGTLAAAGLLPTASRREIFAEPVLLFLAAYLGIALCYPSVLANPILTFARGYPVLLVTVGLAVTAAGAAMLRAGGARGAIVAVVVCVLGAAVPQPVARGMLPTRIGAGRAAVVVLGLDSLSHADDLSTLRRLAAAPGGAWYSHAVSPGLLTNPVWTSILRMQPVHAHGVFHTFQRFPPATDTLVTRAERAGLRTISLFPDQITCAVGSQAGFDEDRSGPIGWRQLATAIVENASVLLPVARPLLPRVSDVPRNHAGTYAYDLDRELDGVFAEGDRGGRALLVAHLTYLHSPRFPSYRELDRAERRRVWWSAAGSVRDRSFDWQDEQHDSDALALRPWKVRRLTTALLASLDRTRFFSPERAGQLLVLSDHGDRAGLTPATFWKPEYHHVPLVTVGLPVRPDPDAPISLLDTAALLGLAPGDAPSDPSVEFIVSAPVQWPPLVRSARLAWDGTVTLDADLLAEIYAGLRVHRPWPAEVPARVFLVFGPGRGAS